MAKAMTLAGLDVHARQTHAATLVLETASWDVAGCGWRRRRSRGSCPVCRRRWLAVYEAGPTGFGLARVAAGSGIDVRVVAPGSIPKGSGDRVKTDRRDAMRLSRGS
jgi:transposase